MSWQSKDYRRPIGNPRGRVPKNPSTPLMRVGALSGFWLGGYVSTQLLPALLGLPPRFWDLDAWGPRVVFGIAVTLGTSMVAGVFGAFVGLSIPGPGKTLNRLLLILLHFITTGVLVYLVLLGLILSRNQHTMTLEESLQALQPIAIGCAVASLALFVTGQFREGQPPNAFLYLLLTVPATLWISWQHEQLFGTPRPATIVGGIAAGVAVVFIAARIIQRDYQQMRQVRDPS